MSGLEFLYAGFFMVVLLGVGTLSGRRGDRRGSQILAERLRRSESVSLAQMELAAIREIREIDESARLASEELHDEFRRTMERVEQLIKERLQELADKPERLIDS